MFRFGQNHYQNYDCKGKVFISLNYILLLYFMDYYTNSISEICMSSMNINVKKSNFNGFLLASYARFRKMWYLCSHVKVFFVYCKIQKASRSPLVSISLPI